MSLSSAHSLRHFAHGSTVNISVLLHIAFAAKFLSNHYQRNDISGWCVKNTVWHHSRELDRKCFWSFESQANRAAQQYCETWSNCDQNETTGGVSDREMCFETGLSCQCRREIFMKCFCEIDFHDSCRRRHDSF